MARLFCSGRSPHTECVRLPILLSLSLTILVACGGDGDGSGATVSPTPADTAATHLTLEARDNAFDRSTIRVPAGVPVQIEFTTFDAAPHNFAIYETQDAEEEIFVGRTIRGPDKTITYEFESPEDPGAYFFRCDVHPVIMTGNLIVE